MIRPPTARTIWKVSFAATALLEIQYIFLLMQKVDAGANDSVSFVCPSTFYSSHYEDDGFSISHSLMDRARESMLPFSQLVSVWVGPFFCSLCLVESLVRAVEGRKMALDNRMLDDLEESLLHAAQRSSVRLSIFFIGAAAENANPKVTKKFYKALRSWVPPVSTIAFWLFILPTNISTDYHHRCGSEELNDSAVLTQWIKRMSLSLSDLTSTFHGLLESVFWTKILPYTMAFKEPQRFFERVQIILRWIRFARFAAPLFRMGLKLHDQVRAFFKARRQSRTNEIEKLRRIERPSLISSDIKRLAQQAKLQTSLARVSSFSLESPSRLNRISSSVMETVKKRREFGKKISNRLAKLQKDYLNFDVNDSFSAATDLYDRVVKMSHEIAVSIQLEKGKYSHRYDFLRALLSSRRYLISPRTRFSLVWRMTVTNCLLLEIARLCASWHLSETFSIPLSQIVNRLLVDCKVANISNNNALAFIADQINRIRRHIFDLLPILGPPPVDLAVCIPSGPQALLILHFGKMLEFFVDAVVFMDIFVWFLTGDIDSDTHSIIPKPFFTRCILPGTLVQVLDHPTLPHLLPGLLKNTLAAVAKIGYSRCIRWLLALVPALKLILLEPMKAFFFQHIEDDEGLMHIAESVGILTPERKGCAMDESNFFRRPSSDAFNTSQVGLAYDSSPLSSRQDLQSMMYTEGSSVDVSSLHLPFSGIKAEVPYEEIQIGSLWPFQ